ncbi:MAG: hypothetical protein QM650_16670 [Microlunatus sp.]
MSSLQVRSFPGDLHDRLAERSRRLGVSMSEYVTRVLRADLERPLLDDWIAAVRGGAPERGIDVVRALDEAREDYDPGAGSV